MARRKLFCRRNRLCYRISLRKEYLLRDLKTLFSRETYARARRAEPLPALVKGHRSAMLRRLHGVDMGLQQNKVRNLALAGETINGVVIAPGESFSFWGLVGPPTARRGYLPGLAIAGAKLTSAPGGGLCQLANLIHWLVLNSPLTVTELHHHSDALFPDERRRVPFGTGTSVFYKHIDYQFKNTTDQAVQLLIWQEGEDLCGELRAQRPFPLRYRIVEEGSRYVEEADGWYRVSRVWREAVDRATGERLGRELVLDNHSRVLFDPALIPADEIGAV
ncbi:hypothetical protein CE91St41_01090 [Oscillospiraceae bacterium]|nr:hypothetical protein CE91St40_01090 [Oscillospiraceae bacterium]BDF73220.1 hypothetical protein CE91St41_01090 [Oscillospiraceae bacterium]